MYLLYFLGPAAGALDRVAALRRPLLRLAPRRLVRRPLVDPDTVSAGASGAIFGVLGATFMIARGRQLDAIAGQIGGPDPAQPDLHLRRRGDQRRRPRRRPCLRRPLRPLDRRRRARQARRAAPAIASRSSSARWPRSASSLRPGARPSPRPRRRRARCGAAQARERRCSRADPSGRDGAGGRSARRRRPAAGRRR